MEASKNLFLKNYLFVLFFRSVCNYAQGRKTSNSQLFKMKQAFLITFEVIDVFACITNLTTLQYVCKNFPLKTHVFMLLFLDSLSSTIFAVASTILDTIFLTKAVESSFTLCSLAYVVAYLPVSFGAILTLLITFTRYFLAIKSAKNIHPSPKKVSFIGLGIFTVSAVFSIVFFTLSLHFGIFASHFIVACAEWDKDPNDTPFVVALFLLHPSVCNVLSLLTDINMLRFLHSVLLPFHNARDLRSGYFCWLSKTFS